MSIMSLQNSEAGYHSFHNKRGEAFGSFEVYWYSEDGVGMPHGEAYPNGWYWIAAFPGCLPDSEEPNGPFKTSIAARRNADEYWCA